VNRPTLQHGRAQGSARRWLAWGDAGALFLFTMVGLRFHNIALGPADVLRTALPLLGAWFIIAGALRMYERPGATRFLLTWLVAVPLGMALRQIILGRPFGPSFLVFLAVGGTLTLGFLLAWRLVAALVNAIRSS
jgi:hypothetical protein